MSARRSAAVLVLALAGCTAPHPAPAGSAPPSPRIPGPAASATPVAIHIVTRSGGGKYVTMTQRLVSGRIVYELRALSSEADRAGAADAVATFEQPHITFHDRNGKTMIADAPEAKITQRDKSVLMSGGVHARTQDGNVLTCDRLRYDGRTEMIHGDGHVVLTGQNGVSLTGERIDGDMRLNNVRISRAGQP